MTTTSADMLRLLGSGIRPTGAPAASQPQPIEGSSFSELLAGVQKGEVTSGQQLSIKKTIDATLTTSQLERLSTAADAAEASGASRVLAVIDNQAVTIDVASRTIEDITPWAPGSVTTDVDAVMMIPDEGAPLDGLFAGVGAVASAAGDVLSGLTRSGSRSLHELLASISEPGGPPAPPEEPAA